MIIIMLTITRSGQLRNLGLTSVMACFKQARSMICSVSEYGVSAYRFTEANINETDVKVEIQLINFISF